MPKFRGEDDDDDAGADLVDGAFRGQWRKHSGVSSMKNAAMEVAICGFGSIRLGTKYHDEENVEDERQDVDFAPVFSAYSSVVYAANSKRIDKSDSNRVSLIVEYSKDEFKEKWPEHDPASSVSKDDRSHFDWTVRDSVFVVEFYEKIERKMMMNVFVNEEGNKVFVEDKDLEEKTLELELAGGYRRVARRKIKRTHIEKSVICGSEYLEEPRRIVGKILPVLPFYGKYSVVDGKVVYEGLVRKEKDPSRLLNMQVSNLAEQSSTSHKEIPIAAPEQMRGLESEWAEAHIDNRNIRLLRPLRDQNGNIVQAGPLGYTRPPSIDPATQGLIQFTTEHIRSTSGGMPQDIEDPDASGKAILAVQKRVDMHTYSIMGNIVEGMKRMGECFIHIVEEIYVDNRKILSISRSGKQRSVQLNKLENVNGKLTRTNVIKSSGLEVYADVGKTYQAQRRETIEFLKELVQLIPPDDPRFDAVISMIIDNMEGVGLDDIKDFNRKRMLLNGFVKPEKGNQEEEQLVADAQAQEQQPDATQQLLESQAALNMAEAQGKQAQNIERLASADKKQAETAKILEDIGLDRVRETLNVLDRQQQSFTTA
jgi:hypothetical protein